MISPHWNRSYGRNDIVDTVWLPAEGEPGQGCIGISVWDESVHPGVFIGSENEDFEYLFYAVYDEIYDPVVDTMEADEWLADFVENRCGCTRVLDEIMRAGVVGYLVGKVSRFVAGGHVPYLHDRIVHVCFGFRGWSAGMLEVNDGDIVFTAEDDAIPIKKLSACALFDIWKGLVVMEARFFSSHLQFALDGSCSLDCGDLVEMKSHMDDEVVIRSLSSRQIACMSLFEFFSVNDGVSFGGDELPYFIEVDEFLGEMTESIHNVLDVRVASRSDDEIILRLSGSDGEFNDKLHLSSRMNSAAAPDAVVYDAYMEWRCTVPDQCVEAMEYFVSGLL